MAMQHLGIPASIPGEFGRGTGEESETPILIFAAIDPGGVKCRMAHQIDGQPMGWVATLIDGEIGAHGVTTPNWLAGNGQESP